MDEQPPQQPLLDRPIRWLLDVKIGTVVKAYGLYLAISLVLGVIGLIVVLSSWHHESSGMGGGPALREPGTLSWGANAGETVTPAEYHAVRRGTALRALRTRFGEPATKGRNPFNLIAGDDETCLGYRSSASSILYLFCFESGRLIEKQSF